jgi:hypothetical protein
MTTVDLALILLIVLLVAVLIGLRVWFGRRPEEPAVLESGRRSDRNQS